MKYHLKRGLLESIVLLKIATILNLTYRIVFNSNCIWVNLFFEWPQLLGAEIFPIYIWTMKDFKIGSIYKPCSVE